MGISCCNCEKKIKKRVINYNNKNLKNNQKNLQENKIKEFGFKNIGNTCYMNSFLQILLHIPNFISKLKSKYGDFNDNSLIKCLINLYENPCNYKYLNTIIGIMYNKSSEYKLKKQNDSQDFGIELINEIIKDIKGEEDYSSEKDCITNSEKINEYKKYINKYQNPNNEIFIEKMFIINESHSISKLNGFSKIKFYCSLNMELSFPKTINEKYLNEYSLFDLLDFNYDNISKINKNEKFIKNTNNLIKICKLPEILIITIVRAVFKEDLNNTNINFPKILNLKNYIDFDLLDINKINTKYELFAINEKIGNSKSFGHYYCHIYLENNWYLFDDELVKIDEINLCSKEVVGLFYKNIDK